MTRARFLFAGLAILLSMPFAKPARADGVVYYWGDFDVNNVYRVGRYDIASGVSSTLPLDSLLNGSGIDGVGAAPHGSSIVVAGAMDGTLDGALLQYGPLGGAGTALRIGATTDDYTQLSYSPDSTWIAFLADLDFNGSQALYVVPAAGGTVTRVSQMPVSINQYVLRYAWAHDSHTLAFFGSEMAPGVYSVWTVDVTNPGGTLVEVSPGGTGTSHPPQWLAFDAYDRVYFISDFQQPGTLQLFRANADGSNLEQVPGAALANEYGEANVITLGMSPEGGTIAFGADAPASELFQVYVMPVNGTTPVRVSAAQTVSDGYTRGPGPTSPIAWSPDGAHLAVAADWNPGDGSADNDFSAWVLPALGPAGGVRVLNASTSMDAQQLEFASSTSLIVLGDLAVNNDTELYRITDFTTADQNPVSVRIQGVVTSGDISGFTVVPVRAGSPAPEIVSITDVGNDQGRQVSLVWKASGLDVAYSQVPVTGYAIFRRIDPALAPPAQAGRAGDAPLAARGAAPAAAQLAGWHYVTSVPAFAENEYAVVVPTLEDSTVAGGLYESVFLVRATTSTPAVYVDSAPDSGYSVDNLAPAAPANLAFSAPRVLAWDQAAEADFAYHTVYGSPTGSMGDAALIGHTVDPSFDVNATPYAYYLVTTTDFSGNEGPDAALMDPATTAAAGLTPTAFAFVSASPNPFRSGIAMTFDVPRTGPVDLRVFDSSGRRVRSLAQQRFTPGRYTMRWDGSDDHGLRVAPGVYFARLRAGAFEVSRRIVLTR